MRVLVVGGGGFLSQGLIVPFEEHGHTLRLMDVVPFKSPHEVVIGDVADYQTVEKAMSGIDGLLIAHMLPGGGQGINYQTPGKPFSSIVAGTANLFHAAASMGVRRAVVISTTEVLKGHGSVNRYAHTLQALTGGYYGLSKAIQEVIAEQFARTSGMGVACLRVGYIVDGENNVDKYGRHVEERNVLDTDRRDIGEVARLCLESHDLTYEVLHVMSTEESMDLWDVRYTCERLRWKPRYDFSWLREPSPRAETLR